MLLIAPALAADPALVVSPEMVGNAQSPRWSPDGIKLAWEVNDPAKQSTDLYVGVPGMPAAPRRIVPVARGASTLTAGFSGGRQTIAHELSWAPAATGHFVYGSNGRTDDYELYLDTNTALTASPGADGGAAWSPDGRWIAFSSARTGEGDLYLLDATNPAASVRKLSGDPVASELYAAWSPESRRIAFVGHTRTGDNLYVVDNLDFPAPRALTAWQHTQTRPSWSPDGTMIAFYSDHANPGRFDLYAMRLDGTPTLVAQDVELNPRGPVWTPEGKHVLYVKKDPNRFSPVWAAPVAAPSKAAPIATDTVGNGDLDVVRRADGRAWLAVAAQGRTGDAVRDYKRIYVMALPALP